MLVLQSQHCLLLRPSHAYLSTPLLREYVYYPCILWTYFSLLLALSWHVIQNLNISISLADGTPGQVTLNGQVVTFPAGQDPDTWFVDWMDVYPPTLTKGEPVWISFHTR